MAVVLLAGGSGFIGQALSAQLSERGDRVLRLVRRPARNNEEIPWDPSAGVLDPRHLEGVDAVVNLCGANVGEGSWTLRRRQVLRESRIDPTHLLAATCAKAGVRTLVNASATGIYGDRGEEMLDERSASGGGFLADLCVAWEHALRPADDTAVRVVRMRFGLVLDPHGGVLPWMMLATRLCMGGPIGSGLQWTPWISRTDAVRTLLHAVDHRLVSGPVLAVAPGICRQKDMARAIARAMHRPAWVRLPAAAVSAALGERGRELLLYSQRCRPSVLTDSGFVWKHPDLASALELLRE